jgi:hypothetical protein
MSVVCLIAGFYSVDRGLRHRLPGFSSLDRLVVLRRVSAGSGTNGHTAVVVLRGRLPVSGVGSIGIIPIGHVLLQLDEYEGDDPVCLFITAG